MARYRSKLLSLVFALALSGGCDRVEDDAPAGLVSEYEKGYALAHWQADKLRHIDKLLIVKGERDEIGEVTAEIARIAEDMALRLEAHAAAESIVLDREYLPDIEAAARDRMGFGIAGELLLSFGCDFEDKLLFTEAVAVMRMLAIAEEMEAEAPDDAQRELWAGLVTGVEPVLEQIRELLNTCDEAANTRGDARGKTASTA